MKVSTMFGNLSKTTLLIFCLILLFFLVKTEFIEYKPSVIALRKYLKILLSTLLVKTLKLAGVVVEASKT